MTAQHYYIQPQSNNAFLARLKRATPQAVSKQLYEADWEAMPLPVLEWATSRKGVSLNAALHGFFRADPMRFNYLHKHDVPQDYRATCRLLDALCLRINSGFFTNTASRKKAALPAVFDTWIACQRLDAGAGKMGRWVLCENVLAAPSKCKESLPFAELTSPIPRRFVQSGDWRAELREAAKLRFQGLVNGQLHQA